LHELGMRLTYRTVRVLMAVADEPGSSNRGVSEGAGISDQGQVSKLLARLKRAGLVQNAGVVIEHGMPNAWTLTEKGRMVHGAIAH
jgi:DNA-binding MarR family transcriptional regulator